MLINVYVQLTKNNHYFLSLAYRNCLLNIETMSQKFKLKDISVRHVLISDTNKPLEIRKTKKKFRSKTTQ